MLSKIPSEQIVCELKEIETQERNLEEDALSRLAELHRRRYAVHSKATRVCLNSA
jgi:hypothetical protein